MALKGTTLERRQAERISALTDSLRTLVEACEYVRPFAGAVCVEASVKNIREAGRFMKAVEQAQAALDKRK